MPKPTLTPGLDALEYELIVAMKRGLKRWRPDLSYPESYSDMQACARGIITELFNIDVTKEEFWADP